jgi:zinc transport system substrate-binding protein
MRPSERRLLANAGMIVWIGPQMESYLEKIIRQQDTVVVSAMQAKGLKLLNRRTKDHSHHTADNLDPHIWISAHNAIAISRHISQQLISQNPEHRARYSDNLQKLTEKITQLSRETSASLKNNTQPFITYHDAFQYFEDENRLNYIDSISFGEEAGVSIKHLQHIKSLIAKNNIQCLLYQIPRPEIIASLTGKTAVKAVAIDPLGILIEDAEDAWFKIMRDTTLNFKRCLSS